MSRISLLRKGFTCLNHSNLAKINPIKIGYICPDKTINFQTINAASEFAKNQAVKALKGKNPYEKIIIQCKNRILDIIHGDKTMAFFDPLKYKEKISIIHGHPDLYGLGKTNTISSADYKTLMEGKNIKEIIAYNSLGEYAKLIKKASPKNWLGNLWQNIKLNLIFPKKFNAIVKDLIPAQTLKEEKALQKEINKCIRTNDTKKLEKLIGELEKYRKLRTDIYVQKQAHKELINFGKTLQRNLKQNIQLIFQI